MSYVITKTEWTSINFVAGNDGYQMPHIFDFFSKASFHWENVFFNGLCQQVSSNDSMGRLIEITRNDAFYGGNVYGGGVRYDVQNYGGFSYGAAAYYGRSPGNYLKFKYDPDGRLLEKRFPGDDPAQGVYVKMEYDNLGRLSRIYNVEGYYTEYGYDAANRLTSAEYRGRTFTFEYDVADNLTVMNYPNGIVKTMAYNNDSLITEIKFEKGAELLYKVEYTYDDAHRRATKAVTLPGPVTDNYEYSYDPMDQLLEVKKNSSTIEEYEFNLAKNRTSFTENDTTTTTYSYDDDDRILTSETNGVITTFSHNNRGDLASKTEPGEGTTEYTFNAAGELRRIRYPDNSRSIYDYDPGSIRRRKTEKNAAGDITADTRYFYADLNGLPRIISEEKLWGISSRFINYIYGYELISRDIDGVLIYFLAGDDGNIIGLADEEANITDRYVYSNFGKLLSHIGSDENRILFISEPIDPNSELSYLRARYYNSSSGRFISPDPSKLYNTNNYIYCENNPLGFIDPDGNYTKAKVKSVLVSFRDYFIKELRINLIDLQCNEYAFIIASELFVKFAKSRGLIVEKTEIVGAGKYYRVGQGRITPKAKHLSPGEYSHYGVIIKTRDPRNNQVQYWTTSQRPVDIEPYYEWILKESTNSKKALSATYHKFRSDSHIEGYLFGRVKKFPVYDKKTGASLLRYGYVYETGQIGDTRWGAYKQLYKDFEAGRI